MSKMALQFWTLAIVTFLLAANMSAGSTVLIDFEVFPGGSPIPAGTSITNHFAPWGVTFSSVPPSGASQATFISNDLPTSSLNNFLAPGGPQPDLGGTLILDFSIPVTEVGSFFIDDQDAVTVTAYDMSLNPITTVYSDGSPTGFDSWSISHSLGIARVELVGGSVEDKYLEPGPDGWGIDDLAYTQIPEPATLLLLILGGLGITKRKVRDLLPIVAGNH